MSNYRPISVLPVISRPFEKLVTNQLYQYMNDNAHLSSSQSGFLRLHSTVTCLLKNTDDLYNGMDLGKLVGPVFIDLIRYSILLIMTFSAKARALRCKQRELSWFKSYLSNRKQFCRVNGVDSKLGKYKLLFHNVHVSALFSSSSTSMISHKLSRILPCPCMLMTPVCATSLTIRLG